jgi:hypothetical protein
MIEQSFIVEIITYRGYKLCRHGRKHDLGFWVIYSENRNEGEQGAYATVIVAKNIVDLFLKKKGLHKAELFESKIKY